MDRGQEGNKRFALNRGSSVCGESANADLSRMTTAEFEKPHRTADSMCNLALGTSDAEAEKDYPDLCEAACMRGLETMKMEVEWTV